MISALFTAIVAASAAWVYWDATGHGIGRIPEEKGFLNTQAGVWAIAVLLLWIIAFPLYLTKRSALLEKAKATPIAVTGRNGKMAALCIVGGLWTLLTLAVGVDDVLLNGTPNPQQQLAESKASASTPTEITRGEIPDFLQIRELWDQSIPKTQREALVTKLITRIGKVQSTQEVISADGNRYTIISNHTFHADGTYKLSSCLAHTNPSLRKFDEHETGRWRAFEHLLPNTDRTYKIVTSDNRNTEPSRESQHPTLAILNWSSELFFHNYRATRAQSLIPVRAGHNKNCVW